MDSSLLERARAGDREALARLLEEVAPLAHRFGLRMCRHAADAEDVLQDTLLSVAKHLGEFRGDSSLSSWVFTLARTACARRRRGIKNQPHLPEEAAHAADSGDDPAHAAEQRELSRAVDEALSSLSEEHREVLLLRDMEGLTAAEVAKTTGLSVEAVKSRLHRARAALRNALKPVLEPTAPAREAGCPDILAAFSRKLEGDLESADCAAMEEHLAVCPSCASVCGALRTALGACRAQASGKVSPEVQSRVRAALRELYGNPRTP